MDSSQTNSTKRRIITTVGLLIVFATFIAKEIISETLKEKSDGINAAENIFLIRTSAIDQSIFGEDSFKSRFAGGLFNEGQPIPDWDQVEARFNEKAKLIGVAYADERSTDSNIASFDAAKSLSADYRKGIELETEMSKDAGEQFDEVFKKKELLSGSSVKSGDQFSAGERQLDRLLSDLENYVFSMRSLQIIQIKTGTKACEEAKAKIEKQYTRWWIWSIGLYIIGWGLNFYAVIKYGAEPLGG